MTDIAWPELLPCPLIDSFLASPISLVRRTQFDGGPMRTRQEYTDGPVPVQLSFNMTAKQFSIFNGFIIHELSGGASAFLLRLNLGNGYNEQQVFLNGEYQASKVSGGVFRVDQPALAVSRDTVGENAYFLAKNGINEAMIDQFRIAVNEDYPAAVDGAP